MIKKVVYSKYTIHILTVILIFLMIAAISATTLEAVAFDYVFGTDVYPRLNIPRPAQGEHFIDPDFHTDVERITGAWPPSWEAHIYSNVNLENANSTYVIIGDDGEFLYTVNPAAYVKDIKYAVGPGQSGGDREPRWDPVDPNIFYYRGTTRFYQYDIRTDQSTILHDFSNDYPTAEYIHTDSQGAPSADGRYWAFMVKRYGPPIIWIDVIVYDKQTDTIVGRLSDYDSNITYVRWAGMSPSGNKVILRYYEDVDTVCNRDFTGCVPIVSFGHSDVGITKDGRDVLVAVSGYDIRLVYLDTGQDYMLVDSGPPGGVSSAHASASSYATPGWAVISYYGDEAVMNNPNRPWVYDSIFMVELTENNPRIWRLAHSVNVYADTPGANSAYYSSPKASISGDGMRVYFTTNWAYNATNAGGVDIYRINLPQNWYQDLEPGFIPQCSDSIDNDGDGLIDYPQDAGCASTTDNSEYTPPDTTPPATPTGLVVQ